MKLKRYFYLLSIKPSEKRYGYKVKQFDLESFGPVYYAQWKHPAKSDKYIRENEVVYLRTFLKDGDISFQYSNSGFCNGGLYKNISEWKYAHAFNLTVAVKNLSSKTSEPISNNFFFQ